MPTAFLFAFVVAAIAAIADWRNGEIPNWVTLPPLATAPIIYGLVLGPHEALISLASAFVCASVPYSVFRGGGMGGGDVKLFAALGATTGFDISTGLEIQLVSLVVAGIVAASMFVGTRLRSHTRRGKRGRAAQGFGSISIRLGGPVLLGTSFVSVGRLTVGSSIL